MRSHCVHFALNRVWEQMTLSTGYSVQLVPLLPGMNWVRLVTPSSDSDDADDATVASLWIYDSKRLARAFLLD